MSMPTAVLLASGGLDSTTLGYWLSSRGFDYVPLFINYGQHCADHERNTLATVLPATAAARIEAITLADVYRDSRSRLIHEADLWVDEVNADDLYLPYRSLLLLSAAAAYAQAHGMAEVYAGFINSNHAKEIDCSSMFFDQLADLLSEYGGVRVMMPFRELSKVEVARIGLEVGAPIAVTYSCQVSARTPCGACPNCVDRLDALAALGAE